MHLINAKLAGQDIPTALPNSLIPPNLRGSQTVDRPEVTQPSSASKDLFDLFNDSNEIAPSAPAGGVSAATAFLPQPPSRRSTGTASSRQLPATRGAQTPEPSSNSFGKRSLETFHADVVQPLLLSQLGTYWETTPLPVFPRSQLTLATRNCS